MSTGDEKSQGLVKIDALKLIVFDLDYTLWPFWVDTNITPPFKMASNGDAVDSQGGKCNPYPEVTAILIELKKLGYDIAIASRTHTPERARELTKLLKWDQYFDYTEIYPGKKTAHFKEFKKNSKYDYKEMLFFDDERRNIQDLEAQGVISILVENGVNWGEIERGIGRFIQERQS
ncbi:Magnesium-dependent phosphatase 1 [Halotydeus destructor]|nr:Magnesium-dependent phosphatase 1 [Halotydeus destructor]